MKKKVKNDQSSTRANAHTRKCSYYKMDNICNNNSQSISCSGDSVRLIKITKLGTPYNIVETNFQHILIILSNFQQHLSHSTEKIRPKKLKKGEEEANSRSRTINRNP